MYQNLLLKNYEVYDQSQGNYDIIKKLELKHQC